MAKLHLPGRKAHDDSAERPAHPRPSPGEAGPDRHVEERAPESPAKLPRRAWVAVLKGSLKEFKDDELTDRAAALTYYGVLSLFPALLVLVSLLGIAGESATDRVLTNLRELTPGSARDIITRAVEQLQNSAGTGSVMALVGIVLAVWSASGYVAAFIRAANAVYDMPEGRPVWKILPVRVAVTVVLMVLAVACALIVVFTGGLASQAGQALGIGDTALTVWSIREVARAGGAGHVHDRDPVLGDPERQGQRLRMDHPRQLPGTGDLDGRLGRLRVLRRQFRRVQAAYNKTYGIMAGVIVFLVRLWISNLAILLGLEFDAETVRQRAIAGGHPPAAEPYTQPRDTSKGDEEDVRRLDEF